MEIQFEAVPESWTSTEKFEVTNVDWTDTWKARGERVEEG